MSNAKPDMYSIEICEAIGFLQKSRNLREEKYRKIENEQVAEYKDFMMQLRITKEESVNIKENIRNNLGSLTTHEHTIRKFLRNNENVLGLPISIGYYRQASTLFFEGLQFINDVQNIYHVLSDTDNETNNNLANLLDNIESCTNSTEDELYRVKSLIVQVETLRRNTDVLQEQYYPVTNGIIRSPMNNIRGPRKE